MHLMIGKPIELTTALPLSSCLELVEANVQPTTQVFGGKELTGTIQDGILLATLRQVGQIGGYVSVKARFTESDNCTFLTCKFEATIGMLLTGGLVASLFSLGMAW